MKKAKILIVEDQEMISTNIKMILQLNNYSFTDIAITGQEALKSIEQNRPDLIIMDIALPGNIDGIDIANKVNEKWNIPIIYLTAKKDIQTLTRAKETKPYGYITKDINLTDILPIQIDFALYKYNIEKKIMLMQEKIIENEKFFHGIAGTAKDAIILLNDNGQATYVNDSAINMFGFTFEEFINNNLVDLIAPKAYYDYYKSGFSDFKSDGFGQFIDLTTELDVLSKNETPFTIEVSMASLKLNDQWYAICIFRDISIRKQDQEKIKKLVEELRITNQIIESNANETLILNETLKESKELLKKANASKDRFFSIIAQNFKDPLQIINGYTQLLKNDFESFSKDDIKLYLNNISSSSDELIKLFDNLLQWSRIQRGAFKQYPDLVNIKKSVEKVQEFLEQQIKIKKINVITELSENMFAFVDPSVLFTILMNLLSNAVKFSNINSDIVIKSEFINNEKIEISIKDFGVGIDEITQSKLFDINFRHSTLGTFNEKGSGLGLILCKELLSISNGTFSVKSLITQGSTFSIVLPLHKID